MNQGSNGNVRYRSSCPLCTCSEMLNHFFQTMWRALGSEATISQLASHAQA
jgi:hypothetical protein